MAKRHSTTEKVTEEQNPQSLLARRCLGVPSTWGPGHAAGHHGPDRLRAPGPAGGTTPRCLIFACSARILEGTGRTVQWCGTERGGTLRHGSGHRSRCWGRPPPPPPTPGSRERERPGERGEGAVVPARGGASRQSWGWAEFALVRLGPGLQARGAGGGPCVLRGLSYPG